MKKYSLFIIGVCLLFISCQHNDICIAEAPTTPKLVIKFFDSEHPRRPKAVENFNIRELNSTPFYYEKPITDTLISVPLRTDQPETSYEFVIFQDSSIYAIDTLKFTYDTQQVFISRACGYRDEFTDFNTVFLNSTGTNNWIENINVLRPNTIKDEKTAHLYIYH